MSTTIHVAIGNSDNRLTQQEWSELHREADQIIRAHATRGVVHGAWVSPSTAAFQNACWAVSLGDIPGLRESLRICLSKVAEQYRQESIAWSESETEFLSGVAPVRPQNPMDCRRCGVSLLWSKAQAGSPVKDYFVSMQDGHLGFDCAAGPGGHEPIHDMTTPKLPDVR